MSVVALASARATDRGAFAGLLLGRGIGLLLGWHVARLPRQGSIGATGAPRGPYRLTAWPRAEGGCWFLAALQVPGGLQPGGPVLEMHAPELAPVPLTPWAEESVDAAALAQALAARAGGYSGAIALFLADLIGAAAASAAVPPLSDLLERFCAAAAEEDGAVEVILPGPAAVVLQGWGDAAGLEGTEALLLGGRPRRLPVEVLRFARDDIAAPGCGLIEIVEAGECDPAALEHLLLVVGRRLKRRRRVERPAILAGAEGAQHLREMQARLQGSEPARDRLCRLVRPAYAGRATLAELEAPLAAACDLVLALPGRGVFVNGWLADPQATLTGATVMGPDGLGAPLAPHWQRVERPDVVTGLAGDPRFAGLAGDRHGFAAFLPGAAPAAREGWHLAIETREGSVGYLPLRPAAEPIRAGLRRAAGLIDLHKPSGEALAEGVLRALLAAAAAAPLPEAEVIAPAPRAARALLLALPRPDGPAATALSCFLADPPAAEEALVVACGPAWRGAPLARLRAALRFYGLQAGIAVCEFEPELPEAWEIAAGLSDARAFVPLAAAGPTGAPGWRRQLQEGLPAGAAVAAPLLLHEDHAVRSLGFLAGRAGAPLRWPGAGLPAAALREEAPRAVLGAALAGALVTRAAWRAAGGFAALGLTGAAQETGFFLRLAAAGGATRVLPAVRLLAPEAPPPEAPWRRAALLAERGLLADLLPTEGEFACAS